MDSLSVAFPIVIAACREVGFTPPTGDQTLADWADDCLDSVLAPRGGAAWQAGHSLTIDAMEAAMHGNKELVVALLRRALEWIQVYHSISCSCNAVFATIPDLHDRGICVKCGHRRQ